MKVSDAVVEVAAKAAYAEAMKDHKPNPGGNWKKEMLSVRERYRANARAALEAALPLVLGEPVAEVSSAPFGVRYITCQNPEILAPGTKLYAPKEQQP